jgi:hypothetical protein
MFSADVHIRTIGEAEHGTERLNAIAEAIREADEAGAHNWRFHFRFENIRESVFHDDAFKAILCFPELLKIYDDHPELEDEYADDMLLAFKWILENMLDFHQVSRDQIERNFAEYKRRCEYYGVSPRVYHMKYCRYLLAVDQEKARQEFEAFQAQKRDGYSDCQACETNFAMRVALEFGEEEKALELAKPILKGELRCGEIPHYTYCHLTEHYLYSGNIDEASYYGELCERYTQGDPEYLDATGVLLALYGATDPSHGWNLFKQCLPTFAECKNPEMRLRFADGAFRLLQTLCELNEQEGDDGMSQAPVLRVLPLKVTRNGVKLAEVRDYFYQISREIARQLDRRNGSAYFNDKLSRTVVPVDHDLFFTGEQMRSVHGITRRIPSILIASLPEKVRVSYEQMEERVRANVPEGAELVTCTVDEEGLYVSYRRDGKLFDYVMIITETPECPPGSPVGDLSDEQFERMMNNPVRYIMRTTLCEPAQVSYHYVMQLFATILPEMLGLCDIMSRHAYSGDWVRFAGTHQAAVMPSDLFGLYLTGDQDSDEVWMTTMGLCMLGMRELEIIGSNTRNFRVFADILDRVAAQVVDHGMLPDEGETFGVVYSGEEPYNFKWARIPEQGDDKTIAGMVKRETPSGMLLIETDDGDVPLVDCKLFEDYDNIHFPSGNRDFRRRIALAKQTFHYLQEAVKKPFARCAIRLEFQIPEEIRDEVGYGIELLWTEISSVDGDTIRVEVKETEDTLPDIHEGDILTVDPENVAGWMFIRNEGDTTINEQDAFLIEKEDN